MFDLLADLIYPRKCINCKRFGEYLCSDCFSKISYNQTYHCSVCARPAMNGMTHPVCLRPQSLNGVIPVVVYNGIVKKLIYQFKYSPHLSTLRDTIGEIMIEGLSQNESFYSFAAQYTPALIPIPLSAQKFKQRGYNHAELLTSYVAQYFSLRICPSVLVRHKNTKPQYRLNREERIENIHGAFEVRLHSDNLHINLPENVILIDDITTSFSTLREAAKVLKRSGVKRVLGVTFAKEV